MELENYTCTKMYETLILCKENIQEQALTDYFVSGLFIGLITGGLLFLLIYFIHDRVR